MKITVKRFVSNAEETVSLIYLDGVLMCFGLEDEYREQKVAGETRIPEGVYPVLLRTDPASQMNKRYTAKFPEWFQGHLWLQNVPGFEWIYIHMGNKDDHTEGCILVAEQARIDARGEMTTPSSEPAFTRFYKAVVGAALNGTLVCEVIDGDR